MVAPADESSTNLQGLGETSTVEPTTFCMNCEYPLLGLQRPICPECGRGFDPNDSATFLGPGAFPRVPRSVSRTALAIAVLSTVGLVVTKGGHLAMVLPIWAFAAGIGAVATAPLVYFCRDRVRWQIWELLAFLLPFEAWLWCFLVYRPKTLANLGEPVYFAVAIPVAALVRVLLGRTRHLVLVPVALLAALCSVAIAIYFITPALPE